MMCIQECRIGVHYRSMCCFFFSSRRRHTRCSRDWSSDVCSSDLKPPSLLASQIVPTAASFLAGQPRLFTSEQNVCRCLHTHRTCYPPDYRQLAERGLSPRKIRSLVGCSRMMLTFPSLPLKFRKAGFTRYGFKAGRSGRAFPDDAKTSRRPVCLHPSCFPLSRLCPALCRGTQCA